MNTLLTVREKIDNNEPILLFRGIKNKPNIIELSKNGRYIDAVKDNKNSRVSYSFDLKTGNFIKHEKNKEDKYVDAEKITGWFYGHHIITNDYKFGLLILYNKYHRSFHRYRSVVRFIERLSDETCMNYEKWLAIDVNLEETNEILNRRNDGRYVSSYSDRCFSYTPCKAPSEVDKKLIKIIRDMGTISVTQLNDLIRNYSPEKQKIIADLLEYRKQDEYSELFLVSENTWRSYEKVDILVNDSRRYDRNRLVNLIQEYNLKLERFIPYLREIKAYEHTNLDWVLDNYEDYLKAELFLRDGKLRKVNKYPSNLVQMHHNRTSVIKDIEGEKQRLQDIEERKREKEIYDSYQYLTDINKRSEYSIVVPTCADDIIDEGNRMGHCVGSYIGSIRRGITFIIFMRKTEKLDIPYITVEVINNNICTALGRHNRRLEKEEKKWLEKYAEKHNLGYTAYPKLEEAVM